MKKGTGQDGTDGKRADEMFGRGTDPRPGASRADEMSGPR